MISVKSIIDLLFDFSLIINALVFVPQIVKILRLKAAKELSFVSFSCMFLLQLLFGLHGLLHQDYALLIGMIAAMMVSGIIAILILIYR